MKELLKKLREAEERANAADRAYDLDPENKEKDAAFDEAYKEEYRLFTAAAEEVVKITAGQIDIKTARAMVQGKREKLEALFA